ncbi:MAG: radical SAM protein [Blautia sp.]|nr:radical SAM protein [Blautia sp.]
MKKKNRFQLRSCVWEITLSCCFSCKYCGSKGGIARNNELTTEECLRVIEQLAELGCERVSLIGGEVFMRSDWETLVLELKKRKIRTSIITNGYMISEKILSTLKTAQIESIAVSLDGPEKNHDKYRQTGSYRRGISAIECLTKNHIPVSVITTIHKDNVPYLEEFYQLLTNKSICAWQLQACSPMGNATKNGIEYAFDFNEVIDFVELHMWEAPFSMGIADNIGYFTEREGYLRGNLSGRACFAGCRAGLSSIGIDSAGNVRGCESMYDDCFIEGNLREKTLQEIWESPDAFAYNRKFKPDFLSGECKTCEYGKKCAGGCRSYNYFTHEKLYEALYCARIQS